MEVELTDHLGYEPHQEPPGGAGNTRNGIDAEDADHRARAGADRHAARSRRELRAADRPQAPAALRGVRRQDPRALQPRAVDARHRGAPGGDLRRQGRPRPDQPRHRRGHGRRRAPGSSGRWRTSTRSCSSTRWCSRSATAARCSAAPATSRSAITIDGDRDVLGMWFQETEGAKFWMQVLTELKQRGVQDILICCVDGLKGFPEAIEAVFPQTTVQTCIVHLIRHSLKYVPAPRVRAGRPRPQADLHRRRRRRRPAGARGLRREVGRRFPVITQAWLNAWEYVTPFLAFAPEVRRVIYTTDESVKGSRAVRRWFSGSDRSGAVLAGAQIGFCGPVSGWAARIGVDFGHAAAVPSVRRAVGRGGQRALGCAVGVVDPRAKRRIWGCVLPRSCCPV